MKNVNPTIQLVKNNSLKCFVFPNIILTFVLLNNTNMKITILNITSWTGICADAIHVYGNLIICDNDNVTLDNVEEWNVNHLGEKFELRQPMTLEIAKKLDRIDGGKTYQRSFMLRQDLKHDEDYIEFLNTNRFDTFEEIENFAIKTWKEMNIGGTFVSLYNGEKYDFTDITNGEKCITKIL